MKYASITEAGSSREAGGLDKFGAAASDAGDSFLKMLGFGG